MSNSLRRSIPLLYARSSLQIATPRVTTSSSSAKACTFQLQSCGMSTSTSTKPFTLFDREHEEDEDGNGKKSALHRENTEVSNMSEMDDRAAILLSQQKQMITSQQQEIVVNEQKLLDQLLQVIRAVDDTPDARNDCALLESSKEQLQDFFLVVCVGEFNAGKSSFINALLGDRYVREGITPTTTALHMIKYGGNMKQGHDDQRGIINIEVPLRWLKGLSLVDTPGTNAVIREHQHITETFVPRSDLIIFLTSAERPFSESEREFMHMIREWGKKLVVVINKVDLLESDADRETVKTFVKQNIAKLLGFEPQVFCVSSRNALTEKLEDQYSKFTAGLQDVDTSASTKKRGSSYQWSDLESHILKTLNSMERVQIKLENPLGVADKLNSKYQKIVDRHLSTLQEDKKTIEIIEKQLQLFREEMIQDFNLHQQRLQNVFHELIDRSQLFFDEFLTWGNARNFFNSRRVEERFNREAIADFIPQIELVISDMIDWILDRRYRQWKAVVDFVQKRTRSSAAADNEDKLVGSLRSEFNYNRKELLLSIGKSAENVVRTYDREEDIERLNKSISSSLSSAGILTVGAITLGSTSFTMMSTLMTSTLGIAGAAVTLLGAASVLPYKRRQTKKQFKSKANHLHTRLRSVLQDKFIEELDEGIESIRNAIAPYSRFVKLENDKFEKQHAELENVKRRTQQLRSEIRKLVSGLPDADGTPTSSKTKQETMQPAGEQQTSDDTQDSSKQDQQEEKRE